MRRREGAIRLSPNGNVIEYISNKLKMKEKKNLKVIPEFMLELVVDRM